MQRRSMFWVMICLCLAALAAVVGAVSAQPSSRAPTNVVRPHRAPDTGELPGVGPRDILQIVLQPRSGYEFLLEDAHIDAWSPTNNYGGDGALQVRPTSDVRHSLLRWQLQNIVPAGSTILSAELELSSSYRLRDWDLAISAYPLLGPWDESSVTWNQASSGVPWNTPGCGAGVDRASAASATTTILSTDAVPGWHSWQITTLVQDWVDNPESNYGLILVGSGGAVRYDFQSAESGAQDLRPKLIIEYSDAPVSPTPTTEPSRTPSPTGTRLPTVTNTPTDTPESWIDVRNAIPATCLQDYYGDTTGKANNASYYGSVTWPETGPEDVYVLNKSVTSDLNVTLQEWQAGYDLDVFLLGSPDPDSLMGGERVGYGDQSFTYPNLGPGTYYIVVDGFTGAQGAYRLYVNCLGEPTPTPTRTNTPVFTFYPLLMRMPTPTPAATATFTPTPTSTPGPTALPYAHAVNCGGNQSFTFEDGFYYNADQAYTAGHPLAWGYVDANGDTGTYENDRDIYDTNDDTVFQTHRYAMDSYRFGVPTGQYEVRLHFAELFRFTPAGGRVFAVDIEGQRVLDNFDMVARGFKYTAYTETVYVDVTDGALDIAFFPQSQEYGAAINGIRVTRIGPPAGS